MTTSPLNTDAPEPARYADISSLGAAVLAVKRHASALVILHAVIWGGFTALAAGTSTVMIRWDIIATMIHLDRLSGTVQTRQEWSNLQGQIASYFWSGYMFSGGWLVGTLYLVFLALVFAGCWATVHMTSLRIVASPKRLSAFEGFVLATPRLAAGVLPYLLWVVVIAGLLGYRLAPKLIYTRNEYGSWQILDILGALPLAAGASILIAVSWIFLLHQAALGNRPRTAWLTCIPLVWKAPAAVIGRWLGHIMVLVVGGALAAYAGYWLLTTFSLSPYTSGLVAGVLIVLVLSCTTWVTISLLPLWQTNSQGVFLAKRGSTMHPVFSTPVHDGDSRFHADSAEWVSQDEGAAIYVPTVDGGVTVLSDASPLPAEPEHASTEVEAFTPVEQTPSDSDWADVIDGSTAPMAHDAGNFLEEEVLPTEAEQGEPLPAHMPSPISPTVLDHGDGENGGEEPTSDQPISPSDEDSSHAENTESDTGTPKARRRQPPPLRRSR